MEVCPSVDGILVADGIPVKSDSTIPKSIDN